MMLGAVLAGWDADNTTTVGVALVGFFGVGLTLFLNGRRLERQRRRDLHARALAAITAYGEMPYRIRRRAPKAEERAALSDDLSRVKAEVDVCQVLLAADGHVKVANAFDRLYNTARATSGTASHSAWMDPPIPEGADEQMNAGGTFRGLAAFRAERDAFADVLRRATLPCHQRAARKVRTMIPCMESPLTVEERRPTLVQDTDGAGSDRGDSAVTEQRPSSADVS